MMMEDMKCPKCGSIKTVHHGYNTTVKKGKRRRRKCEHGHTFYEDIKEVE